MRAVKPHIMTQTPTHPCHKRTTSVVSRQTVATHSSMHLRGYTLLN